MGLEPTQGTTWKGKRILPLAALGMCNGRSADAYRTPEFEPGSGIIGRSLAVLQIRALRSRLRKPPR
jgi:hypothetical protein